VEYHDILIANWVTSNMHHESGQLAASILHSYEDPEGASMLYPFG